MYAGQCRLDILALGRDRPFFSAILEIDIRHLNVLAGKPTAANELHRERSRRRATNVLESDVAYLNPRRHVRRALIPRAVLLVYHHGIPDIVHYDVLEMHVGSRALSRVGPCLDPNSVLGVPKSATLDVDSLDGLFVRVLAKTSYADTMSWTACDFGDCDLFATVAERDTVVPRLDVRIKDFNVCGAPDVDAVCVRAVLVCNDFDMLECDIFASQYIYVELLTVQRCHLLDYRIHHIVQSDILYKTDLISTLQSHH